MNNFITAFIIMCLSIFLNVKSNAQLKLIKDPIGKSESDISSMMYGYQTMENSYQPQGKIIKYTYQKYSFLYVFEFNKVKHLFINNINNPSFNQECMEWIYENKFNYTSEKLWTKAFETGLKSNPIIPMFMIKYTDFTYVLTLKVSELYDK